MRAALSVLAMTLLAVGCSKKDETGGATAETTKASPAAAFDFAAEGPSPGKWKMTTTHSIAGAPKSIVAEVCLPKTSFKEMQAAQQQAGVTCTDQTINKVGDAIVSHAACTTANGKMVVDTKMTGDFRSRYTVESTTVIDPAPMPSMREMKMTILAERLGDC